MAQPKVVWFCRQCGWAGRRPSMDELSHRCCTSCGSMQLIRNREEDEPLDLGAVREQLAREPAAAWVLLQELMQLRWVGPWMCVFPRTWQRLWLTGGLAAQVTYDPRTGYGWSTSREAGIELTLEKAKAAADRFLGEHDRVRLIMGDVDDAPI